MFALLTQAPVEAAAAVEPATGLVAVLLLAVIQGLAEFLPISSSGHLVLGRAALGLKGTGLALDVSLHVGTLAAVIYAYRRDVRRLREAALDRVSGGHLGSRREPSSSSGEEAPG